MELDLLDKKIRRLVCKLKKHNIDLEVFDHRDIEYGDVLGKGGEGIVQQCTVIYNDMPIDAAVKTLQDNSDEAISITLDEIELLCLARDHVIDTTLHVYGVAAVPDSDDEEMGQLVIITEAGIMNALQLYQKEEVPLFVTYDLWSRLAAAVNTMHMRHIVHQDIKPENILIMDVVRSIVGQIKKVKFKVIDLGMGKRVFTEKIISEDILGTNGYHAPEVLTDECYDFRADTFTLGITFCVMLQSPEFLKCGKLQIFLKQLHAAKKNGMTGKKLYQEVIEPALPDNKELPSSIKSMIWRMLEKQEKRRITLVEVMNTCRIEAVCAKEDSAKTEPQQLSPCTNCSDSGISSTSHRRPPSSNPSTATSRRSSRPPSRASRASRSRTSSTSSTNTSKETTPTSPVSKTRTQKRKASEVETFTTQVEFTPNAKRLRRVNSPIARRLRRVHSTLS